MAKNHSDSERGNPLPPHGLLFPISSKVYLVSDFKTIRIFLCVTGEEMYCLFYCNALFYFVKSTTPSNKIYNGVNKLTFYVTA